MLALGLRVHAQGSRFSEFSGSQRIYFKGLAREGLLKGLLCSLRRLTGTFLLFAFSGSAALGSSLLGGGEHLRSVPGLPPSETLMNEAIEEHRY